MPMCTRSSASLGSVSLVNAWKKCTKQSNPSQRWAFVLILDALCLCGRLRELLCFRVLAAIFFVTAVLNARGRIGQCTRRDASKFAQDHGSFDSKGRVKTMSMILGRE